MNFKKVLLFCILLLSFSILRAQPHLRISTITGFPFFPGDTAYEVTTYDSIRITVVNDGASVFNDFIDIFVRDSIPTSTDTLYSDVSSTIILPGDSVIRMRSGFHFLPLNYDDGDNIVVVWPVARTTQTSGDSTSGQVYFISLAAGVGIVDNEPLIIYPNPSAKYISFIKPEGTLIKQVRISDASGKEVYNSPSWQQLIPVYNWSKGLYFVEIVKSDGFRQVIKLVIN